MYVCVCMYIVDEKINITVDVMSRASEGLTISSGLARVNIGLGPDCS
jgi:bacterioferritin-associated ferredoxin